MYPLTKAADFLDLHIMPIGEEHTSTEYENPGTNPNTEPYPVTETEFVAHGFEAEVRGCKVSARFKQPVTVAELRSWDGETEWKSDNRAAFMTEVAKVWPGVAAHF